MVDVGQPILANAAFQAALSSYARVIAPGQRGLKTAARTGCPTRCQPYLYLVKLVSRQLVIISGHSTVIESDLSVFAAAFLALIAWYLESWPIIRRTWSLNSCQSRMK
jgi:hypothetical protein